MACAEPNLDALEKKLAGGADVGKLSAGLDRLDAMADKLAKSMQTLSRHRRADLDALPLPHLNN